MFIKLAWQSLVHRRGGLALAVISVAVSLFTLLGVEQVRMQAKESFNRTVSSVDLIVGARTGQLNLLLYSVFRIGSPSNNISWQAYQEVAQHPQVAWTIPISLGDSHRGYRVVGTNQGFFTHYRYGREVSLAFSSGRLFAHSDEVVLGATVARQLGYRVGDSLVMAHGMGATSFHLHDDHPFTISGILSPTGTPVDRALYVSLEGMEAIHGRDDAETVAAHPSSITAFMLGLNSRVATFQVQRWVNEYHGEPLLAILPGVALSELWHLMGVLEKLLLLISALVVLASLLGLSILLLAAVRERRREIALLRAIGAGPMFLFLLVQAEALLVLLAGAVLAFAGLAAGLWIAAPLLAERYGIYLQGMDVGGQTLALMGAILAGTFVLATIPALRVCRQSLGRTLQSDG
ncbi:ABC transporter permease [Microbulbifer thermotolerans]|uniref:Peptide ABC transporter permease n=1 Tax=Microbulbifer thermotolerans TaxID=252514 RepID=A0A143HNI3_MICTH|nr:ABC transporter permease [Microbulbifer thermotolerans]AMX03295.1 peptide ABC transporter permease [Microbulbifer thermotolerans]